MLRLFVLVLAIISSCILYAVACSCGGKATVEEEFNDANFVFRGEVVSIDTVSVVDTAIGFRAKYPEMDAEFLKNFSPEPHRKYYFKVTKVYKGILPSDTMVYYDGEGNCDGWFAKNEDYIVYAWKQTTLPSLWTKLGYSLPRNCFETNVCSRTRPYNEKEDSKLNKLVRKALRRS